MSEHEEEQLMEQEALEAIFAHDFTILHDKRPLQWKIHLVPYPDESEENHVALDLLVTVPLEYPDVKPELEVELIQGLADEQREEIVGVAEEEVEVNQGMPCVFAISEALKAWLLENNEEYDGSMYAQMMRKQESKKIKDEQEYEYACDKKILTQTEIEEAAVHKRRAEGTPCIAEHFHAWKKRFDAEMEEKKDSYEEDNQKNDKKTKGVDYSSRNTGFEIFNQKIGVLDLEAMEAAAEFEGKASLDVDNVNEELFDEDESLDDFDFDSDDDDSEDEEPDI